jgi:hypothetical protein
MFFHNLLELCSIYITVGVESIAAIEADNEVEEWLYGRFRGWG